MQNYFQITLQILLLIYLIKLSYQTCYEYSCKECESEEYGKCTKCRDSFKLVDGTCPCADSSCALCTSGYPGIGVCAQCKNGYMNLWRDCYCFIENCEKCISESSCEKCATNYFFNSTSGKCEKNEVEIKCFDQNCETCFSSEEGGCESCKSGYTLKKGKCIKLPEIGPDGNCTDGYFNYNGICEEICGGIDCSIKKKKFNTCASNQCLVCQDNSLYIFSECDNSKDCHIEGCLTCLTSDECIHCIQGRYLIGGQCKNCTSGCSSCSDNTSCDYCLSGFEKNSTGQCIQTNNFDYKTDYYQSLKKKMIKYYHPEELETESSNTSPSSSSSSVSSSSSPSSSSSHSSKDDYFIDCDEHCMECFQETGTCDDCESGYVLINNECQKCKDTNCEKCNNDLYTCTQAKKGFYVQNGKVYQCFDPNCIRCDVEENSCTKCEKDYSLIDGYCATMGCDDQFPNCIYCNSYKCLQCEVNYKVNSDTGQCKNKTNYPPIIFGIIAILLIITGISFCIINKYKKNQQNLIQIEQLRNGIDVNGVNVYSSRHILQNSGSERSIKHDSKQQLMEEFEEQKALNEKGETTCEFCKKKPGKYISDCGCVLCKEHSKLKTVDGDGGKYKVCFKCGKVAKIVVPKYVCQICMQNRLALAHFKCNCAMEVCKICYVKCKMGSKRCPACRKDI